MVPAEVTEKYFLRTRTKKTEVTNGETKLFRTDTGEVVSVRDLGVEGAELVIESSGDGLDLFFGNTKEVFIPSYHPPLNTSVIVNNIEIIASDGSKITEEIKSTE